MSKITSTITMSDEAAPESFPEGLNAWRVELRYQGRRMTVPFFTGPALGEPTTADVLDCVASDATLGVDSFESFCADMGLDTDSRRAHDTWKACQRIGKSLRRLLGEDFEKIAYGDRQYRCDDSGAVAVR